MPNGLETPITPGTPFRASVWEALRRIALRWSNVSVAAPLIMQTGPSGVTLGVDVPLGEIWAKIGSGSNPYSWQEQIPQPNGGWSNGLRSGTAAYEVNNNTSITKGTIVRLDLSRGLKSCTFIYSKCS